MLPRLLVFTLVVAAAACGPATPTPQAVVVAPDRIISFWETVGDRLETVEETHPWRFIGAAGDGVRLRLSEQNASVALTLTGPDGAAIARGNDLRVTLPADGIYAATVRLTQPDPSPYSLTLDYTDRPDPSIPTSTPTPTPTTTPSPTPTPPFQGLGRLMGTLVSGGGQQATFAEAGERHVYLFEGEAAEYVTIRMNRVDGRVDPSVVLYDPNGIALAMDDNSGGERDALLYNIELPESGVYNVQASGDGLQGTYGISLEARSERAPATPNIPEPTATSAPTATRAPREDRLVDHLPLPGRISEPGGFARYPIVASEGEVFTVGVSPVAGESFRPQIQLYNPQGELVASGSASTSNASGDAIIPAYQALETGTYVVLLEGENNTTGSYVISYGLGQSREDVLRGPLQADASMLGEVARRGLRDVWWLDLNQGDVVTVTANPQSATFDPVLELAAPDGTVIGFDDNSGGGRTPVIARATAPTNGRYALRVSAANAGSSGVYSVLWRYVVAAPTSTPAGATVRILTADDVAPAQTYLFYPFQGQAGQRVQLAVTAKPNSGLDPVLALLGPDGTVLAEADDNGDDLNPRLEIDLPADGTYRVRVNGYADSSGAFDLVVEALY